jgi:hypothetical protein
VGIWAWKIKGRALTSVRNKERVSIVNLFFEKELRTIVNLLYVKGNNSLFFEWKLKATNKKVIEK